MLSFGGDKMFEKKYITRGVNTEIPLCLQLLMWDMISSMKVEKQDYLQVFELKGINVDGEIFQRIIHSQEQPEYKNTVFVSIGEGNAVDNKVFVIDDEIYRTMLLAEEY